MVGKLKLKLLQLINVMQNKFVLLQQLSYWLF